MKIVSATIVAFFSISHSWGAPLMEVPKDPSVVEENSPEPNAESENLSISEPDGKGMRPKALSSNYFPFQQALTFRLGAVEPILYPFETREVFVGFSYLFPKFLSPRFEAGADVHTRHDSGQVHAGLRKFYFERSRIRPSVKLGLSHEVNADELLATFTNLKHYFGLVTGALDASLDQNWSSRLEAEVLIGTENQFWTLSLGLVRAW